MVIGWLMRLLAPALAIEMDSSFRLAAVGPLVAYKRQRVSQPSDTRGHGCRSHSFDGCWRLRLIVIYSSLSATRLCSTAAEQGRTKDEQVSRPRFLKVVSRGFVLLVGVVLILATKGLTMKSWSVRGVTAVLVAVVLANAVRAAELDFPDTCIELASVSPRGLRSHTISTRDSVLFGLDHPNRRLNPGEQVPFIAWDTRTGKWLAKMQSPDPHAIGWKFSPDGTLLAIPIIGSTRPVQLWEVGSKDSQGVPALRLLTTLQQRYRRPTRSDPRSEGHASFADLAFLAWTPDSKTLLAQHETPTTEIQFWSRTDKPSVWDETDRDTKWKPWAIVKYEEDLRLDFTVSPDNRSLAVIHSSRKPLGSGQIFDLDTANLREEFQVQRPPRKPYELYGYRLKYSANSKTLAISDSGYLALWNTTPVKPRVEMEKPAFLGESDHPHDQMAFIQGDRWLLTMKTVSHEDRRRVTGGLIQLQFRDAQSGSLRQEVSFPKELGLLETIETLPDGRVMTSFRFRKKNQDFGVHYFLWSDKDLLRYAAEHGSAPAPARKTN